MQVPLPPADRAVVILSGAGLSAASGVPTFRGPGGYWQGHKATDLATPQAFARDPDLVLDFYAMRRSTVDGVTFNPGHAALARLQAAWGAERVVLVTQNIDGLIQAAAAADGTSADVIEMHGTLWRERCARDPAHPMVPVDPDRDARGTCAVCDARLRPHIVWFGEIPHHIDRIEEAVRRAGVLLSVGTSGVVYPAAGIADMARRCGAHTVEVNPDPTGGPFDQTIAEGSEGALPRIVGEWLGG
ncbi:MAG: NAD-dependent deacetylase [Myxococcota bacterium]|jgi:NAD-dependent deacetylase